MLTSSALAQVITAKCQSLGDVGSGPVDIRFITGEFSVCVKDTWWLVMVNLDTVPYILALK